MEDSEIQSFPGNPLLRACGLTKVFPGKVANRDVSMDVFPGEVHALIGENGAGKSTLVGMLAGFLEIDAGHILWKGYAPLAGEEREMTAPHIGMVHQHFSLVPNFTLVENLMLLEPFHFWNPLLKKDRVVQRIEALADQFGIEVTRDVPVKKLSVGEQQLCELLKALYFDCEMLILDEPTAVLTPSEIEKLWTIIQSMKDRGRAVLIIAHKISEIMEIADRVTVLRNGEVVCTGMKNATTAAQLTRQMVGREVSPVSVVKGEIGQVVLELKDVCSRPRSGRGLEHLDLRLRAGEIVGVAGVDGNGQTELFHMLARGIKPDSGEILLNGSLVESFSDMMGNEAGVGRIPDDRQRYGIVKDMSVEDNLMLRRGMKPPYAKRGLRNLSKWSERSGELISGYDIRCSGTKATSGSLSGGNQQKVILAREFSDEPELLLITNPTRGLDIGAMDMIHRRIIEAASAGCAVLLISSDLEELLTLGSRIVVMHSGTFMGEQDGPDYDIARLGSWMAGQREEADEIA